MDLPKLIPGKRFTMPRPVGSADALLLARVAEREKAARRTTAIVTADATDAQRLIDEMAFFAPELRCALFPDWETLPYDTFSPHQDLISERLATLWRISQKDRDTGADVVLVPATTALYRLAPPSFLAAYTFHFKVRQKLDEAKFRAQLTLAGYSHVSQVVSPGEYAVRGGLIDLFPMGSPVPYRVDLFDDEIDSIRTFDPDTQRSLYPVPEVRLLPGREFPMDDAARAKFRSRWRELLEGDPTKSRIYKDMGNGVATAGIEYYLPLFFDETATVFDYLGEDATVVLHGDLEPAFQRFWHDTKERFRLVQGDPDRPALPPESLFLGIEQFYTRANVHAQLALRPGVEDVADNADFQKLGDLSVVRGAEDPLARLHAHIRDTRHRVLLLAESDGRRESLLDFLRASQLNPPAFDSLAEFQGQADEKVGIATAALATGFAWVGEGIDFVTETELFAAGATTRRRKKQEQVSDVEALIKDLSELTLGDPVVHSAHGIGRYRGLIHMDVGQKNPDGTPAMQEFLHLEYADKAVLYVPVSQLQLISRYTGVSADEAPLHKLGSGQWGEGQAQGRRAGARFRRRAAQHLRPPRGARGPRLPLQPAGLRAVRQRFRVRGNGRPERRHPRGDPGHDLAPPHGPAGLRRRGLRQDRGGTARRLRGRHRRQAGGVPRADHAAGRAALPDAGGPLLQVAGEDRGGLALPLGQGRSRRPSRASATARWTSWWARTSCFPNPRSSTTWACSSSTRSTASGCATRSR